MLKPGSRIGRFEIVSPLGSGGMGEVYRARDPRLGRDVALKVLPARFASDPARLAQFETEARATAAIVHPNVLALLEVGSHRGSPFLVGELLDGSTLRELLRGGAMPPRRAVEIAVQICHGLAAAHGKGIVHRDLKPGNVLLTRDGTVKIFDFGIAKLMESAAPEADDSDDTAPDEGPASGTAGYMAPEQVRGLPADPRSDLFALGCIAYEMLSGRRAFAGNTAAERAAAVLHHDPPSLARAVPGLSPMLARVVGRCLEKRPDDRFSSAHDLAMALQASAASGERPVVRGVRRGHLAWAAAGLAGLAVAAAALWRSDAAGPLRDRLAGRQPAPPITSLAVLPLDNLSGDPIHDYLADGMTEELIARLGRVTALRVTARNSVMRFKGSSSPLREIAAALNVDALVVGSVSAGGDRVRVIVQLVRGEDESTLWSNRLEAPMQDVMTLQGAIAVQIVDQVSAAVTPEERAALAEGHAVEPGVYDTYLRGRASCDHPTSDGFRQGAELLERAVALDPGFTAAQSALARCTFLYAYWGFEAPAESFGRAREVAQAVLKRDPGNAEAAATLGMISLVYEWDWGEARERLQSAVEWNPNSPFASFFYAWYLVTVRDYEGAIVQARRANERDPLSAFASGALAWMFLYAGRPGDAVPVLERATELDPRAPAAWATLAFCLAQEGRPGDAREAARRAKELAPLGTQVAVDLWLVNTLVALGERGETEATLAYWLEREKEAYVDQQYVAAMAASLGMTDLALDRLERAFVERSPTLVRISADTWSYRSLRNQPRFRALFRRMRYPPLGSAPQWR